MMPDIANTSILPVRLTPVTLKENLSQKQVQNENSDLFVFAQLPDATPQPQEPIIPAKNQQVPNASTNIVRHPTGLTTTQVNENIRFLITNLNLQLHSSGNYFTSTRKGGNPNDRYYPQLNGTFFVTGTTPGGETIQSTITNFLNGEPVRSAANIPLQHTLLLGQLRAFTANGFNFNANGTLTSPLHTGVTLHRQLDGSLWGSNNITYRLASNGTSVEQQTGTTPLPFTTFFSQMGIQPLRLTTAAPSSSQRLGAFLRTEDPGMFILEPGNTIFYTGREVPGKGRLGPYVYRQLTNGTWEIDQTTTRTTPLPGAIALANTRAYQDANGNWLAPSDDANPQPYNICMLSDGRVLRIRNSGADLNISTFNTTNNTWTNVTSRDISTFGPSIHPSMLNVLRTSYTNQLGLRFDASKGCYTVNGEANPVLRGLGLTAGEFHLQLDGTFFVTNARDLEGRPIMTTDRILGDRPTQFTISSLTGSWTRINERNTPIHGTIALTHLQTNLGAEVRINDNWTFSHNNQSFSMLPSGDFYSPERGSISFSPCLSVNARDREIARDMQWVRDVEDSDDKFGGGNNSLTFRPRFRLYNNANQSNLIFAPHRQIMSAYGINPVRQSNGRFISHLRTGEFSLQADGSFFYSGGRDNQGRTFPASTILIGNDGNVAERTGTSDGRNWSEALSSSAIIADRHLLPAGGGMFRTTLVGNDCPGTCVSWDHSNRLHIPNYGDNSRANCFILPNNMILHIDGSVFHENRWQPIFADNATFNRVVTPEVATMILNTLGGRTSIISNHVSRGATLTGNRPTQTELQAMNDLDLLRSYYNVLWQTHLRSSRR